MKKYLLSFLAFMLVIFSAIKANDKTPVSKWTIKKPFEQRVFIKNNGQFFVEGKLKNSDILYGSREGNEHLFFTKTGLCIMVYNRVKNTEREIEALKEKFHVKEPVRQVQGDRKEEEEKELGYKQVQEFHNMEWLGANPNVEIIAENKVNEYYTYPDARHPGAVATIQANAYKKITYKNIYPNIDLEYYFPEDKDGYKYNIVLHSGADASLIKMQYPTNEKLILDNEKNLNIKSTFGTFIDHAPIANTSTGKKINCSFSFNNNIVSFILPNTIITEETTIDPWVVNPGNVSWNKAYDVDYDNAGNVYINGGRYPYQIKKYSAGGALLWSFTCSSFTPYSGTDAFYGDFSVDRRSGSVYAVEGFNFSGAKVLKINSVGTLAATYAGSSNYTEMWRMAFSRCTNKAVIVGGGVTSPTYHGCYLDTNLTSLTPVTLNGTGQTGDDIALLALDNFGNAYILASTWVSSSALSDKLVKLTLPGLLPIQYMVTAGYKIRELNTYYVQPAGSGLLSYAVGNGLNGLTTSNTNVYSYDGYALKKWAGPTGAFLLYKRVNFPLGGDSSKVHWSGLNADDCDHIFVGSKNKVLQYDANLNLVNTIIMQDTVYDVMLGKNGNLYTSGNGFLSSTQVIIPPCSILNVTNQITNASCTNPIGSATITVSGGTGPYTITWNTTPVQTGSVVSNLSPGTYIATIKDNSCVTLTKLDTIVINNSGGVTSAPVITNVNCNGGSNGAISITTTGTVVPTFTWSTGSNASSITNIPAGTYTVSISGGTCTSTLSVNVTQPPPISFTLSPGIIKCFGDTASVNISVSGGTPTYTVTWNTTPVKTGLAAHGLIAGNYSGGIVDLKGCTTTFTTNLTQPPQIIPTFTTNSSCFGAPLQFTNQSTGGPFIGWAWNFGDGGTSAIQNPQHTYTATGTYVVTLTVTTANSCSATVTQNITVSPQLIVVYRADSVCLGSFTTFSDNTVGVPAGSLYSWSFGDATSSTQPTTVTHVYQTVGVFTSTLTITNTQGCISSAVKNVLVKPIPIVNPVANVEYCPNKNTNVINFTSTPGGSLSQFFWANSSAAIGLAVSGAGNSLPSFTTINSGSSYISATIMVYASFNGCPGPVSMFTITVNPLPKASFYAGTKICEGKPLKFINNSSIGSGFIMQWFWDLDGDGNYNNSTLSNPQYTFTTAGTHTVGLVVESNKLCRDTVKETVYVNYLPLPAFVGDNLSGCPILNVNFTNNSTITAGQIVGWNWNFGNGITSTNQFPPTISYNNSSPTINATYTVSLTLTSDSGCAAGLIKPNYVTVYPHPLPGFNFSSADNVIDIIDPTVYFYNQSQGASTISWYLGDIFAQNPLSNYTNVKNPIHTYGYEQPYTYYVTQWVTNQYGCIDSIKKPVEIKPNYTFYIPNAFSPDGDGLNDGFKGTGIGIDNSTYNLLIFDRWGNLIFKANDLEKAWDGKVNGKGNIVQEDVYVWKVQFSDFKGTKHQYQGIVSVLK